MYIHIYIYIYIYIYIPMINKIICSRVSEVKIMQNTHKPVTLSSKCYEKKCYQNNKETSF